MTTTSPTRGPAFVPHVLDALDAKQALADDRTARYLVRAGMAGVIIGVLYLANYAISANLTAALGDQAAFVGRLAGASVFGLVLFFIVYTRSELTTSTMMMVGVGVQQRRMRPGRALGLLGLCMLGNALGGLVIALLVWGSTLLSGPTLALVEHSVAAKLGYFDHGIGGVSDLFVRAIFCNLLINLAMLVVYKGMVTSDFGKFVALWGSIFVFTVMGFEHSVANTVLFTVFGVSHGIDVLRAAAAIGVAFVGNLVGGGVLIGAVYGYLNSAPRTPAE
ncbi:MAG: formate transporter [Actinobacteria bacterium HGW-Actinobacteria-2]|nr:MAG: formate transporter [Actinobacteria bacterium HGW-Actinobacteria-2]